MAPTLPALASGPVGQSIRDVPHGACVAPLRFPRAFVCDPEKTPRSRRGGGPMLNVSHPYRTSSDRLPHPNPGLDTVGAVAQEILVELDPRRFSQENDRRAPESKETLFLATIDRARPEGLFDGAHGERADLDLKQLSEGSGFEAGQHPLVLEAGSAGVQSD